MLLSQFNSLSPAERMELVKAGGLEITNDPPAPQAPLLEGQIRRVDFDSRPFSKRAALIKSGFTVVD
jgi:hypothetical protein